MNAATHAAAVADTVTALDSIAHEFASSLVVLRAGMRPGTTPPERDRLSHELNACLDIGEELLHRAGYLDDWRDAHGQLIAP